MFVKNGVWDDIEDKILNFCISEKLKFLIVCNEFNKKDDNFVEFLANKGDYISINAVNSDDKEKLINEINTHFKP